MSVTSGNLIEQKQNRDAIASQICKRIESSTLLDINSVLECAGTWSNHHSGIYFLYNNYYELIYIGKIGFGGQNNLQKRMREHRSDSWFAEVRYARFCKFPQMGDVQLSVAERLSIIYMGQPVYNDKDTSVAGLKEFNWTPFFLSDK